MRELKATPGPWHVPHIAEDEVRCNCRSVLSEHRFGGICEIHVDNEKRVGDGGNDAPPLDEAKANAHLIAASPDLYEALINTIQFAEACHRQCGDELMRQAIGADIAKAHAALAKARGEKL